MGVTFQTEHFDGPLDLLLSLLDEKKLDITVLSLSKITEQYLSHLDTLEERDTGDLADFLVVATRLLLLKSRSLLPRFFPEEDEGPSLEEQLRLYKKFVDASKKIHGMWQSGGRSIFRVEPARASEGFVPGERVTKDFMLASMKKLLKRLQPPKPLPKTHIDKTVSVKEKIKQIRSLLRRKKQTNFSDIMSDAHSKTELIVGFLALLELVKQRTVSLNQEKTFENIVIQRV